MEIFLIKGVKLYKLFPFIFSSFFVINTAFGQETDSILHFFDNYNYEKIIELTRDKEDLNSLYYHASALGALHKYEEAITSLEKILEEDTLNLKMLVEIADYYKSSGIYIKSQYYYQKAYALFPNNKYLVQKLAESYFIDNKFEKAQFFYLDAISNDTSVFLLKQVARCYEEQRFYDTATFYYKYAIELNPLDFLSNFRLANILKDQKKYIDGIYICNNYLNTDSLNLRMLKLSGFMYFMANNYDSANYRFRKCTELNDSSEFLNKYYGFSLFRTRQFDLAKTFLEKAFMEDTINANLSFAIGVSCYSSYYKELGIEYLLKTLELIKPEPEFMSTVYIELGNAYAGYYKLENALQSYNTALEINPSDTVLLFKIASFYENRLNDKENALSFYKKFMDTRPEGNEKPSKVQTGEGFTLSYYDVALKRIAAIEEELFWKGVER